MQFEPLYRLLTVSNDYEPTAAAQFPPGTYVAPRLIINHLLATVYPQPGYHHKLTASSIKNGQSQNIT